MNIRVNESMLELLGGDPDYFEPPSLDIPHALIEKAATPLIEIEVDGCIVPASNLNVTKLEDETGTECLWSKFHLEDLVPDDMGPDEMVRMAVHYVWLLRASLIAAKIRGLFRMIVGLELTDLLPDARPSCTIRFHRVRPGQSWLLDNLEAYKHEAIAVCDFSVQF